MKANLDGSHAFSQEACDLWGGKGMSFMQQNDSAVAVREKIQTALHAGAGLLALANLQRRWCLCSHRSNSSLAFLPLYWNLHDTLA